MVGAISGAGYVVQGLLAAAFVIGTNLVLRPLVRRLNRLSLEAPYAEAHYTVEIMTRAVEGSARVRGTAQAMVAKRNDAALEQIVGPLSLEPQVSGATWQVDRSIPET